MYDGASPEQRGVLRFMTAGSVDDGKSTLIGRLLYDSKGLMRDQIAAISKAKHARADAGEIDLALVTDGLESEREQGITIDVAYRYFSTPRRAFVIADAPGHEQYTRNMVTAASTAEVAIILIDASRIVGKGLKSQTRRHAAIAKLMGLDVIVAINKMDLLDWSEAAYTEIKEGFERIARTLDITPLAYVPISARHAGTTARRCSTSSSPFLRAARR
jgi:sulfate adenylyltransferase subunit 1